MHLSSDFNVSLSCEFNFIKCHFKSLTLPLPHSRTKSLLWMTCFKLQQLKCICDHFWNSKQTLAQWFVLRLAPWFKQIFTGSSLESSGLPCKQAVLVFPEHEGLSHTTSQTHTSDTQSNVEMCLTEVRPDITQTKLSKLNYAKLDWRWIRLTFKYSFSDLKSSTSLTRSSVVSPIMRSMNDPEEWNKLSPPSAASGRRAQLTVTAFAHSVPSSFPPLSGLT